MLRKDLTQMTLQDRAVDRCHLGHIQGHLPGLRVPRQALHKYAQGSYTSLTSCCTYDVSALASWGKEQLLTTSAL